MTFSRDELRGLHLCARIADAVTAKDHAIRRWLPALIDRLETEITATLSASGHKSVAAQTHWLSTRQAARRLGCSDRTARRYAARVGRRVGRDWFIPADALPDEEDR